MSVSPQIVKQLYVLKLDNVRIIQKCVYIKKSKYIGIHVNKVVNRYALSKTHHADKNMTVIERKSTCAIIKQHAQDMKDDPERLSTSFIQEMLGVKCK